MRIPLLLLCLSSLFQYALLADATEDLTTKLSGLRGGETVKARIDFSFVRADGDDKKDSPQTVELAVDVEGGPLGLGIHWSPELLQRSNEERTSKGRNKGGNIQSAMSALGVTRINDYLDAAPLVLRALDHAELLSDASDNSLGTQARLLTYKLNIDLDEKDRKYIKELDATAKIWLGPDGFPLAAERNVKIRGRAMLVISFESDEKDIYRFAHLGGRLVVSRHERNQKASGAGETTQEKINARLTFR